MHTARSFSRSLSCYQSEWRWTVEGVVAIIIKTRELNSDARLENAIMDFFTFGLTVIWSGLRKITNYLGYSQPLIYISTRSSNLIWRIIDNGVSRFTCDDHHYEFAGRYAASHANGEDKPCKNSSLHAAIQNRLGENARISRYYYFWIWSVPIYVGFFAFLGIAWITNPFCRHDTRFPHLV